MSHHKVFKGLVGSYPARRQLRAARERTRAVRVHLANKAGVEYAPTKKPKRGVRRNA